MSATKQILLLSDKKTNFLSMKIRSSLLEQNFDVVLSGFDVDEVSKIEKKPKLILFNIESIEEKDKQFLYFIRDLCTEEENRVYVCGYLDEINEVVSILPKGSIMGTFKRPFNITDLMSVLNKEIDKYRQDEGKKHILVVDDSGEMLHAIKTWLSDTYRVSVVNSGANAILFLANHKPDMILLDYEMPLCSGPQMMEMIRAESSTSSIPIMFLTGKGDKESLTKVLSLKPEGYMLKSTSPEKIKETISKFFIDQKAKEYNKGVQ